MDEVTIEILMFTKISMEATGSTYSLALDQATVSTYFWAFISCSIVVNSLVLSSVDE